MGLDQWLMAKTKTEKGGNATGVCSGVFGIVPARLKDDLELCYLRKGYDQEKLILEVCAEPFCGDGSTIEITASDIDTLLAEANRIVSEHTFDDAGYDVTGDDPKFESDYATWMSDSKWKDLIDGLSKAKELLRKDPTATIYYTEWY